MKTLKTTGLAILAGLALGISIHGKTPDSLFEISKNLEIFANLFKELNAGYVDPIEPGKMIKTGIEAMLNELDPYTNLITEADIEEYEFQTTGKYGGIGATMRKRENDIYVGDVYENSPAQKGGLHPGDLVISIDQQKVSGKSIDQISVLLKGSPGTPVAIEVKDAYTGKNEVRMITRGEIEISSLPYAGLIGEKKNIAIAKLTQFTPGCGRQLRNALDSLKKQQPALQAVMLDLRNNPGGLLEEAVNICNLFIDRGSLVVSTKGKQSSADRDFHTSGTSWDTEIPVVILINKSSASASEIVAGTLQDLDRAAVVGERSYGKGLVQTTRALGYNARLKLTTAKYYTPSGRCIQALDYSNRRADGSVDYVADSLQKLYKTKNGRNVKSGGGISPDISIVNEPTSMLAITLYSKNFFFDYATQYAKSHNAIASPEQFQLNETEFNQFVQWLEGKDYSYKTTTQIAADSLEQIAKREKYLNDIQSELTALKSKLNHDKRADLMKHKAEVKQLLENEIVSRYYFQKGRILQDMRFDPDIAKGLQLLQNKQEYSALLSNKK